MSSRKRQSSRVASGESRRSPRSTLDRAGRRAGLPRHADAGRSRSPRARRRARAARSCFGPRAAAPLGRVGELRGLPPLARAREHARASRARDALVDRREALERLVARRRAARAPRGSTGRANAACVARQRDLARERREAVAEAAVDRLLRRPQRRDRLAALVHVVELRAHHRREDAAAAVRRQHADDGHARAADASPPGTAVGTGTRPRRRRSSSPSHAACMRSSGSSRAEPLAPRPRRASRRSSGRSQSSAPAARRASRTGRTSMLIRRSSPAARTRASAAARSPSCEAHGDDAARLDPRARRPRRACAWRTESPVESVGHVARAARLGAIAGAP